MGSLVVLLRGVAAEPVRIDLELAETLARATLEDRGTEQPENMMEQAERPQKLKGSAELWISVARSGPGEDRNSGSQRT